MFLLFETVMFSAVRTALGCFSQLQQISLIASGDAMQRFWTIFAQFADQPMLRTNSSTSAEDQSCANLLTVFDGNPVIAPKSSLNAVPHMELAD